MGHLHSLWHDALELAEDGDLSLWSDELIAESADYPGDAPQFVRLLQQHRWLDGKMIHDWLDYAGLYLIRKYSTHQRDRLILIWEKHGKNYGEREVSKERASNASTSIEVGLLFDSEEGLKRGKPKLEDVKYAFSKTGMPVGEAEKFFNHYESNGWRVGRTPMKSMPHAVANWKKNYDAKVYSPKPSFQKPPPDYTKGF